MDAFLRSLAGSYQSELGPEDLPKIKQGSPKHLRETHECITNACTENASWSQALEAAEAQNSKVLLRHLKNSADYKVLDVFAEHVADRLEEQAKASQKLSKRFLYFSISLLCVWFLACGSIWLNTPAFVDAVEMLNVPKPFWFKMLIQAHSFVHILLWFVPCSASLPQSAFGFVVHRKRTQLADQPKRESRAITFADQLVCQRQDVSDPLSLACGILDIPIPSRYDSLSATARMVRIVGESVESELTQEKAFRRCWVWLNFFGFSSVIAALVSTYLLLNLLPLIWLIFQSLWKANS